MIEFVRFFFGLALVPLSLVFFRLGDPVLLYSIVGGFFSRSPKQLIISIFFFGLLLDLFTPYFGYHLIAYTSVYLITKYIAQHLLTTKSLPSFLIVVLFATLFVSALSIFIMALYSLIPWRGAFTLDFFYILKQFVLTLTINILLALLYYIFSRVRSSEFSL